MNAQPRKTARDFSLEIIKKHLFDNDTLQFPKDYMTCDLQDDIDKALESYLLQESGELVRALELVLKRGSSVQNSDQYMREVLDETRKSLNNFRSRHDG